MLIQRMVMPAAAAFLLALTALAQAPSQDAPSGCSGDTVDRMGPQIAEQARSFLARLKAAVEANKKADVASMVMFPLRWNVQGRRTTIPSRAAFLRKYDQIMNANVKSKISDEKSSRCLFVNYRGFMIGDGEVWIREASPGVLKIVTVNQTE
jgi:hypothetical protein